MNDEGVEETIRYIARAAIEAAAEDSPEKVAAAIAREVVSYYAGTKVYMPTRHRQQLQERDRRIIDAVQNIGSYPPVAKRFGLSPGRICQIVKREGVRVVARPLNAGPIDSRADTDE